MSDQNSFFAKALHDFTMNAAAGDSVRHLTDRGFTLSQIKETLSFPAPEGYIAKVMWERLIETHKVIVDDIARELSVPAQTPLRLPDQRSGHIIEQRDRYGRKSFLRVQKESPEETSFSPEDYVLIDNGNDIIPGLPWPKDPVWVHKSLLRDTSCHML